MRCLDSTFLNGTAAAAPRRGRAGALPGARAPAPEPPLDDPDAARARRDPGRSSTDLDRRAARRSATAPVGVGTRSPFAASLFRLYRLLKVHLAEEQLYASLVEHGAVTPEVTGGPRRRDGARRDPSAAEAVGPLPRPDQPSRIAAMLRDAIWVLRQIAPDDAPEAPLPRSATPRRRHPVHRGWAPLGGPPRWMEPFVLVLLAGGGRPRLRDHGAARGDGHHRWAGRRRPGLPDAPRPRGRRSGHVDLVDRAVGPQRRDYETDAMPATRRLDEWAAVMKERARLIAEFDAPLPRVASLGRAGPDRRTAVLTRDRDGRGATRQSRRAQSGSATAWSIPRARASFSSARLRFVVEDAQVELLFREVDLEDRVQPIQDPAQADLVRLVEAVPGEPPCPVRAATRSKRRRSCSCSRASAPSSGGPHQLARAVVQRRLDRLDVRHELADDEPALDLEASGVVLRWHPSDQLGQLRQHVDMGLDRRAVRLRCLRQ